jgi:SAM-dependent methyltransferase
MFSETSKYRALTEQYCGGCGIDIASGGIPVVPWAWQLELPKEKYASYHGTDDCGPIQLRGDACTIQVDSGSLNFVYASHLLEDFEDWEPPLREWSRLLKKGGYLIVLLPDKVLWKQATERGQPPNVAHKHEGTVGELSTYAPRLGLEIIEDRLTSLDENDYSILFVGRKI